jgi:hypothetical protein
MRYIQVNNEIISGKQNVETKIIPKAIKTKLRDFSPQAKYTDRATAACRRSLVPTFADRGCRVVSATNPHGRSRNLNICVFLKNIYETYRIHKLWEISLLSKKVHHYLKDFSVWSLSVST